MNFVFYLNITKASSTLDSFRQTLFNVCTGILSMVEGAFNLFFDIMNWQILGNSSTYIFNRVFMIIGVIMFFKLILSLITYMVNPDTINDKEKGFGKLVGRIITMLLLLYLLMPLPDFSVWSAFISGNNKTIDCSNSMGLSQDEEKACKKDELYQTNGWLFGALYDLQERIVAEDVLGQLVFGSNASTAIKSTYGQELSFQIFNAFFILNEEGTNKYGQSVVCKEDAKNLFGVDSEGNYVNEPGSIPDLQYVLNQRCQSSYYLYEFNGFTAILVCLATVVLIFMFTFDVALRVIKLGILRLLSPIAAVSYIDPKSSRDGPFANYVKTMTSTYLELFLRITMVYLIIYLISEVVNSSTENLVGGNNPFSKTIIILTLLFFAAQAPKFIMQALGIKSKGTGLGLGAALLGGTLSGAIAGAATGGVWGAIKGTVGGAFAGSQNQWKAQNGQQRQGSASQEARARGAQLGKGEVDPARSGVVGLIGGRLAIRLAHATDSDIGNTKSAMYGHKNMAQKQKDLIDDFRSGKIEDVGVYDFSNNQISALSDAGITYNRNEGIFHDSNDPNKVLETHKILDRLQDRMADNETKYNKLNTMVGEAEKYQKSRRPSANNPDVGVGKNNLRNQANADPRQTKESLNYKYYNQYDEKIKYKK